MAFDLHKLFASLPKVSACRACSAAIHGDLPPGNLAPLLAATGGWHQMPGASVPDSFCRICGAGGRVQVWAVDTDETSEEDFWKMLDDSAPEELLGSGPSARVRAFDEAMDELYHPPHE